MSEGPSPQPSAPLRDWVTLSLIENLGPVSVARLLEHFGTPAAILAARESELLAVEGIGRTRATALIRGRDQVRPDAEIARAAELGFAILGLDDDAYPERLRMIHDPPTVLYVRGQLTPADRLAVAVVGSRDCTDYGLEQAERLSAAMARAGITVVSGLARGIDTAAHRGAVSAGGRTLAVLGSGLDRLYPESNAALADRIAGRADSADAPNRGAVLSEFPLGTGPRPDNFPRRNRIISGLSLGVLVVEAPARSGSLITAELALEQGREVLAVPGRVSDGSSRGCHQLLRQGAALVEDLPDILAALGGVSGGASVPTERPSAGPARKPKAESAEPTAPTPAKPTPPKPLDLPLDATESAVVAALSAGPASVDVIVRATALPAGTVSATLIRLELKGVVAAQIGGVFARR